MKVEVMITIVLLCLCERRHDYYSRLMIRMNDNDDDYKQTDIVHLASNNDNIVKHKLLSVRVPTEDIDSVYPTYTLHLALSANNYSLM